MTPDVSAQGQSKSNHIQKTADRGPHRHEPGCKGSIQTTGHEGQTPIDTIGTSPVTQPAHQRLDGYVGDHGQQNPQPGQAIRPVRVFSFGARHRGGLKQNNDGRGSLLRVGHRSINYCEKCRITITAEREEYVSWIITTERDEYISWIITAERDEYIAAFITPERDEYVIRSSGRSVMGTLVGSSRRSVMSTLFDHHDGA